MRRFVVIAFLFFFILTFLVFAYMLYRERKTGRPSRLTSAQMKMILGGEFFVLLIFFWSLTQWGREPAGSVYHPAHLEGGSLVPAVLDPPSGKPSAPADSPK